MDILEAARALGVAIQASEAYQTYLTAREEAEKEPSLSDYNAKFQEMQTAFEELVGQENPDQEQIQKVQADYMALYQEMNALPAMAALQESRMAMNDIMNDAMQIIYLSVNGEDPLTCQPSEETMQQIQGQMLSM
ncbi:MAG TPA: YlbF family regulator [Clostridiales bacterium]|jgi:cell fate (sporulation/competence/biofilm development) regulator YlbF (YheA/YmcA/DUF963 family)|nr:YlbF family regulator [Clostridiales bacterium]